MVVWYSFEWIHYTLYVQPSFDYYGECCYEHSRIYLLAPSINISVECRAKSVDLLDQEAWGSRLWMFWFIQEKFGWKKWEHGCSLFWHFATPGPVWEIPRGEGEVGMAHPLCFTSGAFSWTHTQACTTGPSLSQEGLWGEAFLRYFEGLSQRSLAPKYVSLWPIVNVWISLVRHDRRMAKTYGKGNVLTWKTKPVKPGGCQHQAS